MKFQILEPCYRKILLIYFYLFIFYIMLVTRYLIHHLTLFPLNSGALLPSPAHCLPPSPAQESNSGEGIQDKESDFIPLHGFRRLPCLSLHQRQLSHSALFVGQTKEGGVPVRGRGSKGVRKRKGRLLLNPALKHKLGGSWGIGGGLLSVCVCGNGRREEKE